MNEPLVACREVGVSYGGGASRVVALRDVDLALWAGEGVALWGRSGSGKTTLLHVLGGLIEPTTGVVEWSGGRRSNLAYVFQGSNLLPHFTAFENVAFAVRAGRTPHEDLGPLDLLSLVGLDAKADNLPAELSGGEAQRVAVARALAQRPRVLLCDEPTGQLDSDTGERVLDLVQALQRELGFTLVLATHDADVARRLDRELELHDGRIERTGIAA